MQISEYCREIETYLCRKNDGHLIRVVGPSFDLVSGWAALGVPLKVAFEGIDRYFDRYYRRGPRRRPVKIDFCEADVLDVFDEWRRATLLIASAERCSGPHESSLHESTPHESSPHESRTTTRKSRQRSLPDHLERVLMRLSNARASGVLDVRFDAAIDRIAAELENARATAGGIRGDARAALIARLEAIDRELLESIGQAVSDKERFDLSREADEELAPFRPGMAADAYRRAHAAAFARLLRSRFNLPTVAFV